LVRSQKIGRTRTCTINPPAFSSAEIWFVERRLLWERRLDRLGDFLADAATPASLPDDMYDNPSSQRHQPKEKK
jgi:hypothetical protein